MSRCTRSFLVAILLVVYTISFAQTDTLRSIKKDTTEYVRIPVPDYVRSDTSAESNKLTKRKTIDSRYIHEYPDYLNIGPFISSPYMTLDINPLTDSLTKYGSAFEGNYSGLLGFNFGYRCIAFSYGVKLPLDPISMITKGRSSSKVFAIKISKLPFIISLDYRRYNGFYDTNTKGYDSTVTEEKPYSIRPDLTFRTYSGSMICNFSWRKYSYSAPINYADRQVRTRFGFLLNGTLSYMQLFSDSSFVANNQIPYFPDFYKVKSIDAFVIKSGPGMGMNLVFFKRMYLSMTLFLMGNNLIYRYTNESGQLTSWKYNSNYFLQGAVALGYNSKRFYLGLRVGGNNNVMRIQGAEIQTSFGNISMDMGFRFNTPGFFRKAYAKTLTKYLNL